MHLVSKVISKFKPWADHLLSKHWQVFVDINIRDISKKVQSYPLFDLGFQAFTFYFFNFRIQISSLKFISKYSIVFKEGLPHRRRTLVTPLFVYTWSRHDFVVQSIYIDNPWYLIPIIEYKSLSFFSILFHYQRRPSVQKNKP